MSATHEKMWIDAVDETDRPVGKLRRDEVFIAQANFRVVHVLVFNTQHELLIQKLSATRTRHPGLWGSSVAAYVASGESYEAAATRRLKEELGIDVARLDAIGKTVMNDNGCEKFIGIFKTIDNGPFAFDKSHIESLEFVPVPTICNLVAQDEQLFTPTFLRVFAFYQQLQAE